MEGSSRFVRLVLFFDLPQETKTDQRHYRQFVKYLKTEGFIRIQYSVYAKLCINNDSAKTIQKRLKNNVPDNGDIRYLIITERQYQNISYKIKDENTSGENATVTVEVETFDYRSALNKSEEYYENNKKKFQKDDGKIDQEKYWDYKISEMKKTEDKIKNEIIFTLHKENDKWILDDISDSDRQKLHGLYGG